MGQGTDTRSTRALETDEQKKRQRQVQSRSKRYSTYPRAYNLGSVGGISLDSCKSSDFNLPALTHVSIGFTGTPIASSPCAAISPRSRLIFRTLGASGEAFYRDKECQHRHNLAAPQSERRTLPPVLRRNICPIIVSHFKKEGDSGQVVECERGWRGGKVVGTSSGTGTVVNMNASTTRMIRFPAIQLAAPPTDVPIPSILLPGNDVLPRRFATNPDHLGIQKLVPLLEPDSPSRTGGTLLREAWASPGRVFARTL